MIMMRTQKKLNDGWEEDFFKLKNPLKKNKTQFNYGDLIPISLLSGK